MSENIDEWEKIWNKKIANEELLHKDFETVFMELKRLTGNDTTGKGVEFQGFMKQYADIKTNISNDGKKKIKSVFEVGCGSGPFLLAFQRDGYKIGGVDYSKSLIDVAKKILINPVELYCGEANNLKEDIIYDCVMSNSVFEYFKSDEYAVDVLEKMMDKARYSIAVLDVHDNEKKEQYLQYRRSIIQDYDKKYKNLEKKFFEKKFFEKFARDNFLTIKIQNTNIEGYWNNQFTYDVYMYKEEA